MNRWSETDERALGALESEMKEDLLSLRMSSAIYAERAWQRGSSTRALKRTVARSATRWIAAGTVAASLVFGSAGWRMTHRPATAMDTGQAVTLSDEALLEQVDSDLSTALPAAMEPLAVAETHPIASKNTAAKKSE